MQIFSQEFGRAFVACAAVWKKNDGDDEPPRVEPARAPTTTRLPTSDKRLLERQTYPRRSLQEMPWTPARCSSAVAMGCAVLKLASRVVMLTTNAEYMPFLQNAQRGIMIPGGCEGIVHDVRFLWEHRDDIVIMTCDANNAFNEPDRQKIRDIVAARIELRSFRALVDVEYGHHSDAAWRIGARTVTIKSQRGTRQRRPSTSREGRIFERGAE